MSDELSHLSFNELAKRLAEAERRAKELEPYTIHHNEHQRVISERDDAKTGLRYWSERAEELLAERDALKREVDQLRTGEFVPRGQTDPERLERLERAMIELSEHVLDHENHVAHPIRMEAREVRFNHPRKWQESPLGEISRELAKREGRQ